MILPPLSLVSLSLLLLILNVSSMQFTMISIDILFYINLIIFPLIFYIVYKNYYLKNDMYNFNIIIILLSFYIGLIIYLRIINDTNIIYYQNGIYLFILLIAILKKILTYKT